MTHRLGRSNEMYTMTINHCVYVSQTGCTVRIVHFIRLFDCRVIQIPSCRAGK